MLTNFTTISGRVGKLREFEAMEKAGDFEAMPKKEALRHRRELAKLRRNLGGIRDLDRLPDAIFVIDTKKEHIAVTEANKLHLPIVAVVDTNCDPDVITHVIPGNDDAIRSGALMCRVLAEAVVEGRWVAANRPAQARPAPTAQTRGGHPTPARGTNPAPEPVPAPEAPLTEAPSGDAPAEAEAVATVPSPVEAPAVEAPAVEAPAVEVAAEAEPVAEAGETDTPAETVTPEEG
jgi:small subunit ribosomal protein S2